MIRCLLVDYGEVISTPLPENTITDLAALADQPRATFLGRYWHHRPAYDLGQPATQYWSQVLDRDLSGAPRVVDRLTSIDVHGWLRLNPLTLRRLFAYARHTAPSWRCCLTRPNRWPEPSTTPTGHGTSTTAITAVAWVPPSPTHRHSSSC